jgi:hypothetical protein
MSIRSFRRPHSLFLADLTANSSRAVLAAVAVVAFSAPGAMADIVRWTDWTAATIGTPGSASGTLTTGSGSTVAVSYSGEVNGQTQTNGAGTNYWRSDTAYVSSLVENSPGQSGPGYVGSTDILALSGASASQVNTITFCSPVTNPIFALLSLGRPNLTVRYLFDSDFSILSSGAGWFGGSPSGSLFRDDVGVLRGVEGHGVILFTGTYNSISWTTSPTEFWHGFQVGVVPAPASAALLGLGGLMAARRRR